MRIICGLLFLALGKPFHCDYILLGNHLLTSVLQLDALYTLHVFHRLPHSISTCIYVDCIYCISSWICPYIDVPPGRRGQEEWLHVIPSETHCLCPLGPGAESSCRMSWASITCRFLDVGTGSTGFLCRFDWFVFVWPLLGLWMPLEDRSWSLLRASGPLYGCCKITDVFQGKINFLVEQEGPSASSETADQHLILFSPFSLWPLVVYIEYASCYSISEKASFLQGFLSIDLYGW